MNCNPDTARFAASVALVLSIVALVLLGATGCRDFEAYVAIVMLAVMSAFVATTQDV